MWLHMILLHINIISYVCMYSGDSSSMYRSTLKNEVTSTNEARRVSQWNSIMDYFSINVRPPQTPSARSNCQNVQPIVNTGKQKSYMRAGNIYRGTVDPGPARYKPNIEQHIRGRPTWITKHIQSSRPRYPAVLMMEESRKNLSYLLKN